MIQRTSPHAKFAYESLPELVFADPQRFFTLFEKHGERFVGAVWQTAGGTDVGRDGLTCASRSADDHRVVSLRLPQPLSESEPVMVAVARWKDQPPRIFVLTGSPSRIGSSRVTELQGRDRTELGVGPDLVSERVLDYAERLLIPRARTTSSVAPKTKPRLNLSESSVEQMSVGEIEAEPTHSRRSPSPVDVGQSVAAGLPGGWLTTLVVALLATHVISGALFYAVDAELLKLLDEARRGAPIALEAMREIDSANAHVAWGSLIVGLVALLVFLRWVYCTAVNLRTLGVEGLRFSPGWAVGWFFVPIMNLFRPYQAMSEIARASDTDDSDSRGRATLWVTTWWVVSLGWGLFYQFALRRVEAASAGSGDMEAALRLEQVADSLLAMPAIAAIVMVLSIRARQVRSWSDRFPSATLEPTWTPARIVVALLVFGTIAGWLISGVPLD